MLSRKQKAAYVAVGAASAAAIVWLRYARSAESARNFLDAAGARMGGILGSIQDTLTAVRERVEEVDGLVHEFAQLGSEQKARAEAVLNETWERLEQTRELVLSNFELSASEIAALLREIRIACRQLAAAKSSQAA
jgi:ABC-type transporter Mla subunit MlaD